MNLTHPYCGRFAPSPTGPLHFGSLVAAIGSHLQARHKGGEWLLRIEDIDPPREVPGGSDAILRSLERLGLGWDGAVVYQSQRRAAYLATIADLRHRGLVYACHCSRKELAARHPTTAESLVYDGLCRRVKPTATGPSALRLITIDQLIGFDDQLRGRYTQNLASSVGDFVIQRADGLFAYQLAVVVDDAAQGITEIVRGADLLDNTPRQIYLQQQLGLPTPRYAHLPIAVNQLGQKLSKQTGAASIDHWRPQQLIIQVLEFLGQQPPAELSDATLDELWQWAIHHWNLQNVPRQDQCVPDIEFSA
ncbi:MAG: tRNA glutamyl-Q(34) synthetase GluQRS [Gammaproteobacteria bacterium]|nr:tRNA glutamyl-Q(34) synthetase GluQRS [Gammaproteobacteria bacterium]